MGRIRIGKSMRGKTSSETINVHVSIDDLILSGNACSCTTSAAPTVNVTPMVAAPTVNVTPTVAAPDVYVTPTVAAPTVNVTPTVAAPDVYVTSTVSAPDVYVTPTVAAPTVNVTPTVAAPDVYVTSTVEAPVVNVTSTVAGPVVNVLVVPTINELNLMQLAFETSYQTYFAMTNKFSEKPNAANQQMFEWDSTISGLKLASNWGDCLQLKATYPLGGAAALKMFQLQLTQIGANKLNINSLPNINYEKGDQVRNSVGDKFNIPYSVGQYLVTMGVTIISTI
jgi:hypothetical protein